MIPTGSHTLQMHSRPKPHTLPWQVLGVIALAVVCMVTTRSVATAECEYTARREAVVDTKTATIVRVHALVGRLHIRGNADSTIVRAVGMACAATPAALEQVQVAAWHDGNGVQVKVTLPDAALQAKEVSRPRDTLPAQEVTGQKGDQPEEPTALLNLTVDVPAEVSVEVKANWGDLEVRKVHALKVQVERSDVQIEQVAGDLWLSVGSGEIHLVRIGGDVTVRKGPGEMVVREIGGSVTVERNQFGELSIFDVSGSVRIQEDGPGDVRVQNVKGDLEVRHDAGGDIRRRDIAGQVQVPKPGPPQAVRERLKRRNQGKKANP